MGRVGLGPINLTHVQLWSVRTPSFVICVIMAKHFHSLIASLLQIFQITFQKSGGPLHLLPILGMELKNRKSSNRICVYIKTYSLIREILRRSYGQMHTFMQYTIRTDAKMERNYDPIRPNRLDHRVVRTRTYLRFINSFAGLLAFVSTAVFSGADNPAGLLLKIIHPPPFRFSSIYFPSTVIASCPKYGIVASRKQLL